MSPDPLDPPARTRKGNWPKGVSGNPSGRPVGSRNRSTLLLEELLDGQGPALMRKAIQLARQGNVAALRLCLERIYPVPTERPINLALPPVTETAQAPAAVSAILAAIGQGQITPGEGAVVAEILETQQRLLEAARAEQTHQEFEQETKAMEAEPEGNLCRL